MKHFINLNDIPAKDLRKIITDAKKRKNLRRKLSTLEADKGAPLKGKLLIQMFEKSSLRTRLSFYLAIKQLGGSALTLRPDELHLSKGGESIGDTAKILSNPVGKAWLSSQLKLPPTGMKTANIVFAGPEIFKLVTEEFENEPDNLKIALKASE